MRPVDIKTGVKIYALTPERDPAVEPGPWIISAAAHVPFADKAGPVAHLPETWRKASYGWSEIGIIIQNLMLMRVEAGKDRSAAGRTERCADECVSEKSAASDQAVKIGSIQHGMTQAAHCIKPHVVNQNQNNISTRWIVITPAPATCNQRSCNCCTGGRFQKCPPGADSFSKSRLI